MKTRCFNKNRKDYFRYGGRGITVSKEWLIFKNFENDMLSTYKIGLTLERIDNNKGYFKNNCRWITKQEQALNTRNVEKAKRFLVNGVLKTIRELANEFNIKRSTLYMRLVYYEWSIEKALNFKGGIR